VPERVSHDRDPTDRVALGCAVEDGTPADHRLHEAIDVVDLQVQRHRGCSTAVSSLCPMRGDVRRCTA
jgi:hypothetical protein